MIITKHIFYFTTLLLTVCNCQEKTNNDVTTYIFIEKKGETNYGDLEIISLKIIFKNNSNNSIFLPNISNSPYFDTKVDYIPIHDNYGSYAKMIDAKIYRVNHFLKNNYKKGSVKDTFRISLPKMTQRYYLNHQGDSIDFFEREYELNEIYCYTYIAESNDLYAIPLPPPPKPKSQEYLYIEKVLNEKNIEIEDYVIEEFIENTIFLKPRESKTLEYDISSFFLQKATYEFVFKINSEPDMVKYLKTITDNIQEINGFKKYSKEIQSNTLIVKSGNFPNTDN